MALGADFSRQKKPAIVFSHDRSHCANLRIQHKHSQARFQWYLHHLQSSCIQDSDFVSDSLLLLYIIAGVLAVYNISSFKGERNRNFRAKDIPCARYPWIT